MAKQRNFDRRSRESIYLVTGKNYSARTLNARMLKTDGRTVNSAIDNRVAELKESATTRRARRRINRVAKRMKTDGRVVLWRKGGEVEKISPLGTYLDAKVTYEPIGELKSVKAGYYNSKNYLSRVKGYVNT